MAAAMAAASLLLVVVVAVHGAAPALGFTRSDFPEDFVFGAATSAYQYEGAVAEDGRSPSIWDAYTHAGKMPDKSNGDVAADGYHKYKDDVKLIAETGLEAYRFSISWSRLIPNGRGAVNPKGLQYYNNLIDELLRHGVQIHVMLYQLDLPQEKQKGVVGINVYTFWPYSLTNTTVDLEATKRCRDFYFGWILEPFVVGDYPLVMKKIVGSRLPSFTKVQSEAVRGALDFIGVNHYYSLYVNDRPLAKGVRDFTPDMSLYYRGLATSNGSLSDTDRVDYMKKHIGSTLTAIRNGANVKGYFAWSFLDVFELLSGFKSQYGLYRVDFNDDALPRQARVSARWYSKFLMNKEFRVEENEINDAGSHAQQ
ncbi:hypothetical protein PR202_ga09282 [Eleusine coracana subsp. coracana]|uniref:4-hydroxy-7-methoxy-3-oxo-3,4-dihydro-2H-1,4-benzoxazin-2-yl glucosidebeta-D-glucosidase n=1 Tax=Eleusine coracana subsp. coracana TaxID=191504 RepID=A0AAV5C537_ELECO|nr:hypothetical protein PR202_ga09282 [Eleusine coracana subsp. coracana]